MPVVDDSGKLIGVVSDYDLLALDSISGPPQQETGLFPSTKSTWKVSPPPPAASSQTSTQCGPSGLVVP